MNWIVVSYSDMAMNHHGYIYQACNFIYTGCTKERTDKYVPNGGHSRHYRKDENAEYRVLRSAKHRYVYFCTNNKNLKLKWESELRYPIQPYPKGDNSENYKLGNFISQTVICGKTGNYQTVGQQNLATGIGENYKMEGF